MASTKYDTLPGSGEAVSLGAASVVDYPDVSIASTFGPVIAPKVYAKDLSTLQLASGGNIAFTLNDEHNASLGLAGGNVVFSTRDKPLRLEAGGAPGTVIDMNSNVAVAARESMSLAAGLDVSIVAQGDLFLDAAKDVIISSQSNLDLGVQKNLGFEVASAAGSITHTVNNQPAIITDYHNGAVRTRIYNLEARGGVRPQTSSTQTTPVGLDWQENEGQTATGGKYNDIVIDAQGFPRKRALVEPTWNFFGGAVGFNFVNPSTGNTLRYHWRVNDKDELELVKMRFDEFGNNEVCQVAAKFGYSKHEPVSDMVFGGGVVVIKSVSSRQGAASPDAVATVSYESLHPSLAYNVHGAVTERGTVLAPAQLLNSPALVSSALLQGTGTLSGSLDFSGVHEGGNLGSLSNYTVHMAVRDSSGNYGGVVTSDFTTVDTQDPEIGLFSLDAASSLDSTASNLRFDIRISDAASLASVRTLQSLSPGLTQQQIVGDPDTVTTTVSGTSYSATHDLTTITQPLQQTVYNYLMVQDAQGNRHTQVFPLDPVAASVDGNHSAGNGGITPSDLTVSAPNSEAMAVAVLDTGASPTSVLQSSVDDYAANKAGGLVSDTRP